MLFHLILNKMALVLIKKVAILFIGSKMSVGKWSVFSINISALLQLSALNIRNIGEALLFKLWISQRDQEISE